MERGRSCWLGCYLYILESRRAEMGEMVGGSRAKEAVASVSRIGRTLKASVSAKGTSDRSARLYGNSLLSGSSGWSARSLERRPRVS